MLTIPNKLIHLLDEFAVSNALGVSVATVRRWRLLGQGPRFTKLGASVRYREEDVIEFINQNLRGGSDAK